MNRSDASATPGPKVIGIDEISIRKGHTYRIVVSDLERRRPIWILCQAGANTGFRGRAWWHSVIEQEI